ncbi:MAG: hypothetical protein IJ725_00925, partial [Ruminococcus sp.]|nr:hypothetical protein [Ruminococcus sp.]
TGGVSVTTTTNRTTTASADAAGTLTAKYSLINYNAGVGSNSSNANNTVYVNSDGTVSVQLTVEDTLTAIATAYAAGGYELDHIELRNAAGTAVISGYENFTTGPMPAQDVTVYAVFKASTPSIDKINNTTISNNAYSVSNIYAGQSVTFTPHSSSYGVITFSEGGTDSSYVTESNGVYTFTVPEYIGAAYNTTKAYTFTITPTNTPEAGIDPQDGQAVTITVNAKYSAVQQAYIRLYTQYTTYKNYGITEADTEEGYTAYSDALEVARTAVADKISDSTYVIPWDSSDTSPTYTVKRTNLTTAFNNIKFKKNTIYALVNYNENIKIFSYGTRKGWFTAKNTTNRVGSSTTNFNMTYEGTTNNGKYLYSYTYYGKSKFVVYQADGTTYCTTSNYGSYKLSGIIDLSTADYSEYYTDLKSNTVGSGTTTTKSSFADFAMTDYTANSETLENDLLEKGTTYSIDNIIGSEKLNISYTGSLKGSGQTVNTSITVTGPMGRSDVTSEEVTLDSSHTWTPDESGKYTLELTAYIGTDGRADEGTPTFVLPTKQYTLYVAYDEIAVYADMNGNVGTPILSFNYSYLDDNNNTVTGTLPYEFDLVTGSESVYSVVLSLPVLQTYGYNDILTNGIEIDNLYIDTDQYNGFIIQKQALRTGTVWLKANSTHMTGFDQIAYGSANRSFKAVFRDSSNNDTLVTNSFAVASGSGVITDELLDNGTETTEDDYYRYNVFYAAYDSVADRNFSYNVKVVAENDISHNSVNYYFDHWEVAGQTNTTADVANGTDINLNAMPRYSDGDITYVAVYKPVDTSARAEITYKFEDFDTDDGNYVYDPDKTTKDETYVKTVKVDSAVSASNAGSVASTNAPIIKSNYFDYTFSSATYKSYDSATNKYKVEATFTKTPHSYKIKVVHSNGSTETVETGYYQQPLELKASDYGISSGKYHWSIYEGSTERVLATDTSYTARFVTSNDVNTSIQTIYLKSSTASAASTANSAIMYSYSSVDYESSTPTAIHNFYIIDAMTPSNGTLVGGGVVYATATTGSAVNQGYRQANAQTVLGDNGEDDDGKSISEKIQDYIGGILNTEAKYSLEYKPQSINNIGFRYLPYENGKDVFRYSDAIGAYIYTFAGTNTNSESLNGQDLRVFSYFIYKDTSNNYHTVVSGMYAQVSRYINTASGS